MIDFTQSRNNIRLNILFLYSGKYCSFGEKTNQIRYIVWLEMGIK